MHTRDGTLWPSNSTKSFQHVIKDVHRRALEVGATIQRCPTQQPTFSFEELTVERQPQVLQLVVPSGGKLQKALFG